MIWLAIDPGLTTGWASYRTYAPALDGTPIPGEFASGEVRGRHEFYQWMEEWGMELHPAAAYTASPDHIIIERWDVRKDTFGKSAQEDARYIIGAVEWWATRLDHRITYHEQRPAEAKRFATNDKLKKLGWYTGGEGHGDDAARHLLVALVKDKNTTIMEALT